MGKWFTYILHSSAIGRYYVGSTDNLEWRLERHNLGWGRYAKKGIPWKMDIMLGFLYLIEKIH